MAGEVTRTAGERIPQAARRGGGRGRRAVAAHRGSDEAIRPLSRRGPALARHPRRRVLCAARPERLRQDHAVADARRASRRRTRAASCSTGSDIAPVLPHRAPRQHDVPELRAVSASVRARQHRVRAEACRHGARRDRDPRRRDGGAGQARGPGEAQAAISSPAASGSAWRWRARWRAGRRCCCSTSRWPRSTRNCARARSRIDGAAAPARHDLHHRHPRPGRGDDDGRPHRRDGCRPPRAGRDPARALRGAAVRAGSPSSSATSICSTGSSAPREHGRLDDRDARSRHDHRRRAAAGR